MCRVSENKDHLLLSLKPESDDLPPMQIVLKLADQGTYIDIESTINRVIREKNADSPVKQPKAEARNLRELFWKGSPINCGHLPVFLVE